MFQLSLSFFTLFYIDNGFLTSPLTFIMISLNPSPSNTSETESIYCAIYSLTPLSSSLLGQAHSPLGIAAAVLQCCVRLRRHPHQPTTTVYHATGTSLVRLDFDHLEWICIGRGRQQSSGGSPDPDGLSAGGRGKWEPRSGCSDIITPSSIEVSSASTEPMQPICNVRAVSLLEVGAEWGEVEQNSEAFFQPLSPLPLLDTLPSTRLQPPASHMHTKQRWASSPSDYLRFCVVITVFSSQNPSFPLCLWFLEDWFWWQEPSHSANSLP